MKRMKTISVSLAEKKNRVRLQQNSLLKSIRIKPFSQISKLKNENIAVILVNIRTVKETIEGKEQRRLEQKRTEFSLTEIDLEAPHRSMDENSNKVTELT